MYNSVLQYVNIDGNLYVVQQGSYLRKWQRQFTATLVANIVELNFVDRGPGIKTYDFTIIVATWDSWSQPYKAGITTTWQQQMQALEVSYEKVNSAMTFIDPFGNPPDVGNGVYFTNLNQSIPAYSTPNKPYLLCDVELIEALGGVI